MNCPHCNFKFNKFLANSEAIPDLAPILCEGCGEVSLIEDRRIRKMTTEELVAVKQSPAWQSMLGPVQNFVRANKN